MTQTVNVPGVGPLNFPDGMSDSDMASAIQKNFPQIHAKPEPSSNTAVAFNAADKGIAGLADSILNTPNNIINLGRAAVHAVSGSDAPFQATPNPDFARRGMEAAGMIKPNIQPQGMMQKGIDYGVQGAVGGALTGGAGLARTAAGAGLGALSGEAAGATAEMGGSPAAVATAGMLPGGAAGVKNQFGATGKTPTLKSGNQIQDETFAKAQAEGYVVPPSAMKGSFVGNRIEGIGGKAAIDAQANLVNQPITNKIARREAGLAPDEPISIQSLSAVRDKLAAPYREVEALPGIPAKQTGNWNSPSGQSPIMGKTPSDPKQLVEDWKSNNSKITDLWNDYKQNHRVETLNEYRMARAKQGVIEKNIEEAAVAARRPELVPQLREARIALAKNYDVERSLNLGNGNVDASVLGRMYDHGAPLTGGLETIAKFQQSFSPFAREGVHRPNISKLEGYGSAGMALAGHAAFPVVGALAGAIPLVAPPAARSFMLSPYMQGGRDLSPGALSQAAQQTSPIVTQGILADILRRQQQ